MAKAKPRRCKDCPQDGPVRPAPHPGPRCATHHRETRAKRRASAHEARVKAEYGITGEQYWALYRYQNGRCWICQRATGKTKRLAVDHSHETGEVRGLLCSRCNHDVLGHLRDNPDALMRAAYYLWSPPAQRVLGVITVPLAPPRE